MARGGRKGGGSNKARRKQPTLQGTLQPTKQGGEQGLGKVIATDREEEEDREEDDHERGAVVAVDSQKPRTPKSLASQVAAQLKLEPNGRVVYRLLDMLSALHCYPDGRPIAIPGLMPSANDLTKLSKLASAASPLAEDAGCPVLEYVALEWLALIALIASGDAAPKGPTIAYFVSRFGRLETDRAEAAAPQIPARMESAA